MMQSLDERLKNTEVQQRKDYLTRQLNRMQVYQTADGRKLDDVSLYTLEWTYIEELNKAGKAYAEESGY